MDFLILKLEELRKLVEAYNTLIEKRDAKKVELDTFAGVLDTEARSASNDESALVTLAVDELRTISDDLVEHDTKISALRSEIDALRSDAKIREVPAIVRGSGQGATEDAYDIELRTAPRTTEVRRDIESRALRALEGEQSLTDEQRTHVDAMIRNTSINKDGALARHLIATGRPAYRSAFSKLVRMDGVASFTEAEAAAIEEVRAINITTDGDGGFLMPFTLDPSIVLVNDGRTNPIRQLATVRTVATDNWQGVNSTGVTASWDNENEEVSDDSPAFTQPSIKVRNAKAFVPFTVEAEDDLAGLAADASMMVFDAIDALEASGFATGLGTDGSKQPQGLITGLAAVAGSVVATATASTYALADVDALSDDVPDRFDPRAVFLMHRAIVTLTRGFATGDDPVKFLASGGPMQLRNRDLHKYSAMASAVADDALVAVCGDIAAAYRINDRLGVTIERVPHLFGSNGRPTGERGWFARKRVGAGVVNANAARVLKVLAS